MDYRCKLNKYANTNLWIVKKPMKDKLHGEVRTCMGSDLVREVGKDIYEEVTLGGRSEGFRGIQWGMGIVVQIEGNTNAAAPRQKGTEMVWETERWHGQVADGQVADTQRIRVRDAAKDEHRGRVKDCDFPKSNMGSHWSISRSPRVGGENILKWNNTENAETKSLKSLGEQGC